MRFWLIVNILYPSWYTRRYHTMNETWISLWREKWILPENGGYRFYFGLTLVLLLGTSLLVPSIFSYFENRDTRPINDIFLSLLSPIDLSGYIFFLIYSSLAFTIYYLLFSPNKFLQFVQAYVMLLWIRIICIYLVPLSPPDLMITLKDPFIQVLFGPQNIITKDLFFSGHISTLTLLVLITKSKWLKTYLLFSTLLAAFFLLWQHVHYSMDVLGAPVFSFFAFYLSKNLWKWLARMGLIQNKIPAS